MVTARSKNALFCCRDISINQSINQFICPEINTHWTGHQGRTQPPLTGAHKNKVSKNNK